MSVNTIKNEVFLYMSGKSSSFLRMMLGCGEGGDMYWLGPEPTMCCTSTSMLEFRRSIVEDHWRIVCINSSSVASSRCKRRLLMLSSSWAMEYKDSFLFRISLRWPGIEAWSLLRRVATVSGASPWPDADVEPLSAGLAVGSTASTAMSTVSMPSGIACVAGDPPQMALHRSKNSRITRPCPLFLPASTACL